MLRDSGAMLDDGMVYWDVRPSANFPTIEVRVADVPATVAETVLLATLIRASVMTALEAERRGEGLRRWHRTRCGPRTGSRPATASTVRRSTWSKATPRARRGTLLDGLVDHVRPALEAVGDYDMVRAELARIAEQGNGAMRQRRAWQRRHDIADVLAEAATATLSDSQISGSSANTGLVGFAEPLPGSTVNARVWESPRSGSTAVVDGATVLASIVPADCGPVSSINHIWYTVPGCGGGTLFITSTPASFSWENTRVAVPP